MCLLLERHIDELILNEKMQLATAQTKEYTWHINLFTWFYSAMPCILTFKKNYILLNKEHKKISFHLMAWLLKFFLVVLFY